MDSVRSSIGGGAVFGWWPSAMAAGWRALTAADVTGVVRRECGRRGVASAKATVTGLRALLRFLYLDGQIARCRWPVRCHRRRAGSWWLLPRAVSAADLAQIMDSCDRRGAVPAQAARDSAILLLLARLGLRAGEVAALTLGASAGGRVRSPSTARAAAAPTAPPADVGEALADCQAGGRPPAATGCSSGCGPARGRVPSRRRVVWWPPALRGPGSPRPGPTNSAARRRR